MPSPPATAWLAHPPFNQPPKLPADWDAGPLWLPKTKAYQGKPGKTRLMESAFGMLAADPQPIVVVPLNTTNAQKMPGQSAVASAKAEIQASPSSSRDIFSRSHK